MPRPGSKRSTPASSVPIQMRPFPSPVMHRIASLPGVRSLSEPCVSLKNLPVSLSNLLSPESNVPTHITPEASSKREMILSPLRLPGSCASWAKCAMAAPLESMRSSPSHVPTQSNLPLPRYRHRIRLFAGCSWMNRLLPGSYFSRPPPHVPTRISPSAPWQRAVTLLLLRLVGSPGT